MRSRLMITSPGSLGDDGNGSQRSASADTADSEGLTLRSAMVRTYLCALTAASVRRSLFSDTPPDRMSFGIRFFLSVPIAIIRAQRHRLATDFHLARANTFIQFFDGMKEPNCPLTSSRQLHRKRSCRRG